MSLLSDLTARIPAGLKTTGGALALVAALQLGVLGWMVAGRVSLLKSGREVVLPIVPVDPRDLFKGDYVRLAYDVSRIPFNSIDGASTRADGTLYITVSPQGDGTWAFASASATYPTALAAGQVVLRGRIDRFARRGLADARDGGMLRVTYGLERYYVPEGKGPALEQLARDKKLAAIVAVGRDGTAAIKGLSANGQKIYDEPLF